jgi:hypothetical protein
MEPELRVPKLQDVAFAMARQARKQPNKRRMGAAAEETVRPRHVPGPRSGVSPASQPAERTPPLRFVASGAKTVRFRLGDLEDFSYVAC